MKGGSLKSGCIKLAGILFFLGLFVTMGIGCGGRDEADPPVLPDDSPKAAVPKTVLATLPVGAGPWDIAVTPDGGHVYVANANDGTISVINTTDYSVFTTGAIVSASHEKTGIAITPDGKYVYIADYDQNSVSLLDTETNALATDDTGTPIKIELGSSHRPVSIAISPDGTHIYVVNYLKHSVSVIETADNKTHTLVTEISVGNKPYDLSITPDGEYVYVANSSVNESGDNDTVSVIRTIDNTVIQTVTVGNNPLDIAAGQIGAYVANYKDFSVSFINAEDYTVTEIGPKPDEDTLGIGDNPRGVALMPGEDYLYVTNEGGAFGHTLTVVETATNTVDGEIKMENSTTYPRGIAISPDGNFVYVTDYRNDSVIVIGF